MQTMDSEKTTQEKKNDCIKKHNLKICNNKDEKKMNK